MNNRNTSRGTIEVATEGLTALMAGFATAPPQALQPDVMHMAKLSILDWASVAHAGVNEPVSHIVRQFAALDSGSPVATAIGHALRLPPRVAAMVNGTTSHALDYDDTHFAFTGHPTTVVLPAAIAMAEQQHASGRALIDAYVMGLELTCRIGSCFGPAHYNAGFHQTATAGTFGATAAAVRLLGLDAGQAQHAFGLAATRASGLKSQFGTMGKPYHAGMAASNGIEVAMLASMGFESRIDGIECPGGFAATHQAQTIEDSQFCASQSDSAILQLAHKFHACCHGTHPPIEALLTLLAQHRFQPSDIESISIDINPQWLAVCCIEHPHTGLEAKFSLGLIAAMVALGVDTANMASFSNAMCARADVLDMKNKVSIHGDGTLQDTASRVTVRVIGGPEWTTEHDLTAPIDIAIREEKIRRKSQVLLGSTHAASLWDLIGQMEFVSEADLPDFISSVLSINGFEKRSQSPIDASTTCTQPDSTQNSQRV